MYSIGRLSEETGVKVPTIRYYEDVGLLPVPDRTGGNQRSFTQEARNRLNFIRHSRELGFPLQAIRELLSLSDRPDQSCAAVDAIARKQLAATERKIARLQNLKSELQRMVGHCAGGKVAECRVIESLSDHSHCEHEHAPL